MRWILRDAGATSKAWSVAAFAVSLTACKENPVIIEPPLCDQVLCVGLPIAAKDTAFAAYGIWPFGVHGADHAADGHPGWDIEFAPGGQVLAAQAGTVQSLFADTSSGTTTIQLAHNWSAQDYRTVYTSIATVAAGITVGASVAMGQVLGVPKTQTRRIGQRYVTYGAIHFQYDDFSSTSGLTNVNAVSAERRLLPEAQPLFTAMWARAGYGQEVCEPFPTNDRSKVYPVVRRWTAGAGAGARMLDVTCLNSSVEPYQFAMEEPEGKTSGPLNLNPLAGGVGEVDLVVSGAVRYGLYRIISDTLWLQLSLPGVPRPTTLSSPLTYVTQR